MAISKVSAAVRAELVIEIHVGTWDGGSTFEQLNEICQREAKTAIQNKLHDCGLRIVGDPVIKVSTFSKDK